MGIEAYILDTVAKSRKLDTRESRPSSLEKVATTNQTNLSMIANHLKSHGIDSITYMGGYHIEKVIQNHPSFSFRYVGSQYDLDFIKQLDFDTTNDILLLSGHILFLPAAIERLIDSQGSIGVLDDKPVAWYIPKGQFEEVHNQFTSLSLVNKHASFDALYKQHKKMQPKRTLNLSESCANVHHQREVVSLILRGKGKTLENLSQLVRNAKVMDVFRFTVQDWTHAKQILLSKLEHFFPNNSQLVVRSSTQSEDSFSHSFAGFFDSILDVGNDKIALEQAIEQVIASYSKGGRAIHPLDEVLVQEQVTHIRANGVIFTRHPNTGAPYYVLSVDHTPGDKDGVTSGKKNVTNSMIAWEAPKSSLDNDGQQVVALCQELMDLLYEDALDIEFGFDKQDRLYLFQVRPLVMKQRSEFDAQEYGQVLKRAQSFVAAKMEPLPNLYGRKQSLGVMPDWNPAEMIGIHPKPLAFSIYHAIITDSSWAIARANLGYKDVTGTPLMMNVMGTPFIDVRASLNSLLPAELVGNYLDAYIDHCHDLLAQNPHWHDKLEFHVAIHALTPDWQKQVNKLSQAGLNQTQIDAVTQSFRTLTQSIIQQSQMRAHTYRHYHLPAMKETLAQWHSLDSALKPIFLPKLITCVKASGVIPFAEFARMAFIGMSFLKEFVTLGVLEQQAVDNLLMAIPTVASEVLTQQKNFQQGLTDEQSFVEQFGHLRPRSYDIESLSYAENAQLYFSKGLDEANRSQPVGVAIDWVSHAFETIDGLLSDLQLDIDSPTLFHFIQQSIQLRESTKFEFMKLVDAMLQTCHQIGLEVGLTREEIAFIPLTSFENQAIQHRGQGDDYQLIKEMRYQQKRWQMCQSAMLPELITNPNDVYCFTQSPLKANFITMKSVTAEVVCVDKQTQYELKDKVVLIESADPGFDWIFSHQIKGLITAFGGMASHMAIRCSEFDIPAAIGCGLEAFQAYQKASIIKLDCQEQRVEMLS